jgi:hypothetical protein
VLVEIIVTSARDKGKSMKKKDFCEHLKISSDWGNSKEMNNENVEQLVSWILSEQLEHQPLKGLDLSENNLNVTGGISKRSIMCFEHTLTLTMQKRYGEATHEIHDFIYGYADNLEAEINELEWFLLGVLARQVQVSLKL